MSKETSEHNQPVRLPRFAGVLFYCNIIMHVKLPA